MNQLGALLRIGRRGKSIQDLAAAVSVNKNTLGDYERGIRPPDVAFLARFSAITGTPLVDLIAALLMDTREIDASCGGVTTEVINALEGYKHKHSAAAAVATAPDNTRAELRTAESQSDKNVDNRLNLLQQSEARNPPRRIPAEGVEHPVQLNEVRDVDKEDATGGFFLSDEQQGRLANRMKDVRAATDMALKLVERFRIDEDMTFFRAVQDLAFFGAAEKHITALIEAIIEHERERRAAEPPPAPDRPEPTP